MDLKLLYKIIFLFTTYCSFVYTATDNNSKCGENVGQCSSDECCNNGVCTKNEDLCLVSKGCQNKYGFCIDECTELINKVCPEKLNDRYGFNCNTNEEGRLSTLYVRFCVEIEDIEPSDTVTYLTIREPNMKQNKIDTLSQYKNLKSLILQEPDFFIDLDYEPLKKLTKLEYLKIFDNITDRANQVEKMIYSIPTLKNLTVSNKLSSISDSISNLKNLEKLDFHSNHISKISDNIEDLKKLKELDLSDNEIEKIPEQFSKLESLEILDLSYNPIKEIPEGLCKLKNLKELLIDEVESQSDIIIPKACCTKFNICKESTDLPVSTNGKCGKEYGYCPSGNCCSKYGWCGTKEEYCSISKGCQSEFGKCNDDSNNTTIPELPVSTNGKCGKEYGKCPSGKCCSSYGWCGTKEEYCSISKGCQSEFGKCNEEKTTTTTTTIKKTTTKKTTIQKTTTQKTTTKTTSKKASPTTKRKCGKGFGNCPSGQCCSQYGWCGKSTGYCGKGCQKKFGYCD